jgi:clan AA aspartic protease
MRGPRGKESSIEFTIDTGFTGELMLPAAQIASLGLRWRKFDRGILADGSECLLDVYAAEVDWDGTIRRVLVLETNGDPLLGTKLLRNHELTIQFRVRGDITIRSLGQSS